MTKTPDTPPAQNAFDGGAPFPGSPVGEAKPARKRKKSTEAEIVLPETNEEFLPVPSLETPAEPGELIDGSQDDITALEEEHENAPLVSAVGDEESFQVDDNEEASETSRKEDVSMADKKAEKTKVEYIRDEITAMRARGSEKIRPRDIIANLAKKNVKVTAPQVSVTLRDFDKAEKPNTAPKAARPAPRPAAHIKAGKLAEKTLAAAVRPRAAGKTAVAAKPAPRTGSPVASVEELQAVGAFVADMGDLARARQMLDAYAAYSAAMSRA